MPRPLGWGQCYHRGTLPAKRFTQCAFFSGRLTQTEHNYDAGNQDLLATKLALEEWRHWLKRALLPFLIWTDHNDCIRTAKRLNAYQSRWALFFYRFIFTITYRPSSKNTKLDNLSRQFSVQECSSSPGTIVPSSCVAGAIILRV